jgi:hypothetical protein
MQVAAAHQLSALRANGVLPMHRLTPAVMTTPTATHSAMHILNTSTYCNQAAALHNSGAAWLTVAANGDWGGRVVRRWQCVSIGLEQVAAVRQLASLYINKRVQSFELWCNRCRQLHEKCSILHCGVSFRCDVIETTSLSSRSSSSASYTPSARSTLVSRRSRAELSMHLCTVDMSSQKDRNRRHGSRTNHRAGLLT